MDKGLYSGCPLHSCICSFLWSANSAATAVSLILSVEQRLIYLSPGLI